jgi:hypothetical protein
MVPEGERHARLEQLFHAAHPYPPKERGEILRRLCPTDASLRAEAEALLAIDSEFQEHDAPDPCMGVYKSLRSGSRLGTYERRSCCSSPATTRTPSRRPTKRPETRY